LINSGAATGTTSPAKIAKLLDGIEAGQLVSAVLKLQKVAKSLNKELTRYSETYQKVYNLMCGSE
jgi:hypothetical protein